MKLYSDSFKDIKGLNHEYKYLRKQLIKNMNYPQNVRFAPACFVLETYYEDGKPRTAEECRTRNPWLPYTSDKGTMRDRLRNNTQGLFRLATIDTESLKQY